MKKITPHLKLNQYLATGICGNDILSSSLYVSGIAVVFAGIYAPLILAFIGLVLFFYKAVYTEVVEALPINGGAYNCLLNSTTKPFAAIAGVTTVLSYMATAVISGYIAVNYVHSVLPTIPLIPTTIVLLLVFALLVISGLKDSAKVALAIFALHVLVLTVFVIIGLFHLGNQNFLIQNFHDSSQTIINQGGLAKALFFAFAASLLGVSGFESSANFVEEQDKGVFRKTLRNMLLGVAIFNPLIALVVLGSMPLSQIAESAEFILANSALVIGGEWLRYIVIADAFLVLSGAVLTAYIGVGGLISRMASDNCLPSYFSKQNLKGSYPRIVIGFFLLCVSILLITGGDLLSMAGVYTVAFLSVMTLFALGNLILRKTRPELKRTYHSPYFFVIFAMISTLVGVVGNVMIDSQNLVNFAIYFIPSVIMVLTVVYLDTILRFVISLTRRVPVLNTYFRNHFEKLISGTIVAFLHNPHSLYEILSYVNRNETGSNLVLVHCKEADESEFSNAYETVNLLLPALKSAGVFPNLSIQTLYIDEPFGPETVYKIAEELKVPNNHILIGAIRHIHDFDYADLGGVRIVL